MIVRPDGSMITQREKPELARVQLSLQNEDVMLNAGAFGTLCLKRQESSAENIMKVKVWNDEVIADVEPSKASHDFFSELLQESVLLVTQGASFARNATEKKVLTEQPVLFADSHPLLVTTRESLQDLNSRMSHSIPMSRFRPNLVFEGAVSPYVEETISEILLPEVSLSLRKNCSRCPMITIDQDRGTKESPEPLRTLATYKRDGSKVYFGVHAWSEKGGRVSLGQESQ